MPNVAVPTLKEWRQLRRLGSPFEAHFPRIKAIASSAVQKSPQLM
jgi:hypothetical protein